MVVDEVVAVPRKLELFGSFKGGCRSAKHTSATAGRAPRDEWRVRKLSLPPVARLLLVEADHLVDVLRDLL